MSKFTAKDIGKRIIYSDRDRTPHEGTIRGVASGSHFVDVKLDEHHHTRTFYYVPDDAVTFIPDDDGS